LIDAVARGDVDVAIAWGPLAGYFAAHAPVALVVTPVEADAHDPAMQFSISAGVRRGDAALKSVVERVLSSRHAEVEGVLRDYHVPLVEPPEKTS
jgi:hypothetical protein